MTPSEAAVFSTFADRSFVEGGREGKHFVLKLESWRIQPIG